ncbi:MAG: iron-containing alcohol dehydrogenase [Firmicutes bacterium]|nr:iron-containing alcohol dehydrogenase [Bacillota bacterium]
MENFIYENKCEILFGDLPFAEIANALKRHGAKKILIVYGSDRLKKDGTLKKIIAEITAQDMDYVEFGGVVANPLLSHAKEGIKIAKDGKVDFILAIGGGSVIDEAKFIAVGAIRGQDAWQIFKNGIEQNIQALPVGAVLTLPAAGSECSTASVVREDKTGLKYAIGSEVIRPRFAYINPRLCMTLPHEQIANGTSDIFAHLLERYFSPQENVLFTDKLLEGAMTAMLEIAPKLYANKDSYPLWSEFCLLGTLAHNDMLEMGREHQDWATHRIENKLLSGIHNIAHGAGLAILFPAWMKYVSKTKPSKIYDFCKNVMGGKGKTEASVIKSGIANLQTFYRGLGLAQSLAEINIDHKKVKSGARKYFKDKTLGAYGKITVDDIIKIINLAK